MECEEIITKYKEGTLETDSLKKRLEVSKGLEARPRYRAIRASDINWKCESNIANLVKSLDSPKECTLFNQNIKSILKDYYEDLIQTINGCHAWELMKLNMSDYSDKEFDNASISEEFSIIYELNEKYYRFLEYQKVVDLRGKFTDKNVELDDQTIMKMQFLKLMFDSLDDNIKNSFFCFDENFLQSALKFNKSKEIRFEDYIKKQRKKVVVEYEFIRTFFSIEDIKDITEKILLTSNATKLTKSEVIEIFAQISETEAEKSYLKSEMENFKKLEEECKQREEIKAIFEMERPEEDKEKNLAEEEKRGKEEAEKIEQEKKQMEIEAKRRAGIESVIKKDEGYTGKLDEKIKHLQNTVTAKEAVIPIFLSWIDKEDATLEERIGPRKLEKVLGKIKNIEKQTGCRASLFLVTNADKEITKKRVKELKSIAKENKLPRLVEGSFGGYASFIIDASEEVKDIAIMSPKNREKVISTIETPTLYSLPRELVDETEQNYVRYKFTSKPNKTMSMKYLHFFIINLFQNRIVNEQPLKFMPFIEKKAVGIDVVLESQVKGISKLADYYKAKYDIVNGKKYNIDINKIDEFLEEKEEGLEH